MKNRYREISFILSIIVLFNILFSTTANAKEIINLDSEINFLVKCFEEYMIEDVYGQTGSSKFSLTATGAARLAGMDLDKIQKNIYIDKNNRTAYQISQSIITLVGAKLDPYNYKGENLVNKLKDSQNDEGYFITDYRGIGDDVNSIESQLRSIIALDLLSENYNKEKAIEALINLYKDGSKNYMKIESEGYILLALSNHKNIDGVENFINEILINLENEQKSDGSFNNSVGKGATRAMARVVQGLVANGIDPLEDERFIKNGKTIIHAILNNKIVKDEKKKSGYAKRYGDKSFEAASTHLVFGALIDIKNQKSMFDLLKIKKEGTTDIRIKYNGDKTINNGDLYKASYVIKNNDSHSENVVSILALYDSDTNKLIDYSFSFKEVKGLKEINIENGIKIPSEGNYYLKAFLWDSLENQNILDSVKYIKGV